MKLFIPTRKQDVAEELLVVLVLVELVELLTGWEKPQTPKQTPSWLVEVEEAELVVLDLAEGLAEPF
jgi:hypothetical protein